MKSTLIALATVLSLSGAAFAADDADKGASAPVQDQTIVTGSIQGSSHGVSVPVKDGYASKAGIDVNPNFLPGL